MAGTQDTADALAESLASATRSQQGPLPQDNSVLLSHGFTVSFSGRTAAPSSSPTPILPLVSQGSRRVLSLQHTQQPLLSPKIILKS